MLTVRWIQFFKDICQPTLSPNEKKILEMCVMETNVKATIKALSAVKTPGADGCSLEFYI